MDERGLSTALGVVSGIEKFTSNLYNISIAERKAKRDQEIFNLDKKVKNAELNKMEALYGEDAVAHEKRMWKLEEKKTDVATEQALANIAQTKQETEQNLKDSELSLNILRTTQPDLFQAIQEGQPAEVPEGTVFDLKLGGAGTVKIGKEPTYYEQYDQDIRNAEAGKIGWEELGTKYPRRREEIEEFKEQARINTLLAEPLEKSPKFRQGRGLSAYVSKDIANIDEKTLKIAEQIETLGDLAELVERADEAKGKGIDIAALLEYFGKSKEEILALTEEE